VVNEPDHEFSNRSDSLPLFFGREAIEKHYTDDFSKQIHLSNNTVTPDQDSPHLDDWQWKDRL
jgi:hypothetical protein